MSENFSNLFHSNRNSFFLLRPEIITKKLIEYFHSTSYYHATTNQIVLIKNRAHSTYSIQAFKVPRIPFWKIIERAPFFLMASSTSLGFYGPRVIGCLFQMKKTLSRNLERFIICIIKELGLLFYMSINEKRVSNNLASYDHT